MTFTPPSFSILRVNTLNIESRLSVLFDRYIIVDKTSAAAATQNSLQVLIARTNQVIQCKTEKTTEREVFAQLVVELREVLKEENEEKIKQATMFLLGALIHRYFRILKAYDNWDYSLNLFATKPTSCRLFNAIRSALQFDTKQKEDFLSKDLKILDVTTIVHALETFRDNMLLEDKHKNPRYKSYPHFADDKNFLKYLQDIIDQHTLKGSIILNQFKAVRFVQSLSKQMENEHKLFEDELPKWSKLLITDYPDFSKLTCEILGEHIVKHVKDKTTKEILLDLLATPHFQTNLPNFNHQSFLTELNNCHSNVAAYTLYGGYTLLLRSSGIEKDLKFCIHQALGIQDKPEQLEEKDMLYGIRYMKMYVENNPGAPLDCTFFGSKDKLITLISQKELQLVNSIKEKAEKAEKTDKDKTQSTLSI